MLTGVLETFGTEPRGWLVFSHCFTCNKDLKAIVRIARGLAERGWGVLRYDFAGLGNSEGIFAETNFTTNCEDLRCAAEYLATSHHAPRFLIGHSFGGAASLFVADDLPSVSGVIALAAPSDTVHLANLLVAMNPAIEREGEGDVTIGGLKHRITRGMVEDFRSHDLPGRVARLRKPILAFHSPDDETVGFYHALRNAGYNHGTEETPAVQGHRGLVSRSLIAMPGSNHLFTNNERDLAMIVAMMDAWCERMI